MTLTLPSRRGFLGGVGAILAAPAIVRVSSLMPIKVMETYGPSGFLTIDMITQEFARLISKDNEVISNYLCVPGNRQSHVDMWFQHSARKQSLEQFSKIYLNPAAAAVKHAVGKGKIGTEALPLPQGVHEVANSKSQIAVRGVTDYLIMDDAFVQRFDFTYDA